MKVDYWSKARQGRIVALDAVRRLAEGYGPGRTARPPELGAGDGSDQSDQISALELRVVAS